MYLNKAIVVGNLTRDPELKTLPSGIKVVSMSIATNRVWKDAQGQKKEEADYHNIVVFGKQAETSAQYLKKGSQAMIEGRLQTRSWDDTATNKKMYRTEIVADRVQFGSRPTTNQVDTKTTYQDGTSKADQIEYDEEDINPNDIPF